MTELTQDLSLAQAHSLIDSYAFDLGSDNAEQLLQYWLNVYHASWIRLATIEALYLGRYKTISIEHILNVWLRIGTPNTHFTYEFERLICRKLPKHLSNLADMTGAETKISAASFRTINEDLTGSTAQLNQTELHQVSLDASSNVNVRNHAPNQIKTVSSELTVSEKPDKIFRSSRSSRSSRLSKGSMSVIAALRMSYKSDWSEFTVGDKMIHQFTPLPDVSSFFNKLKTFGEEKSEGQ